MGETRVKIEPCIEYTSGGRFVVEVLLNTVVRRARFDTLSEAKRFRDDVRAMRPKRERKKKDSFTSRSDFHSADDTVTKDMNRDLLAKAKRETVIRDGKEFTLIKL